MAKKMGYTEEERKEVKRIRDKKYSEKNREKVLLKKKEYYYKNKEKLKKYAKIYRETHKKQINNYWKIRLKYDVSFKLSCSLRNRLNVAIKINQKSGSAVKDLGCSVPELKLYLESKFQPGMTWENWSRTGWHIDHIVPLSSFNLQNREEFLKACHYTNLQPLWSEENWGKGVSLS